MATRTKETKTKHRQRLQSLLKTTNPSPLPSPLSLNLPKKQTAQERIDNARAEDLEQDIRLKRNTLDRLFLFLAIETSTIFLFAFCQAIRLPYGFQLEEWSFKLIIAATLIQITYMLQLAVKYLFPNKSDTQALKTN